MSMFRLLSLLLLSLLVACPAASDDDDSATGDDDDVIPDFVDATIVLAPALDGVDVEASELTYGDEGVETDQNGRGRFTMPSQTDFVVSASSPGFQTTWFEGNSGERDFQFSALVGPADLHDVVVADLGLPLRDPDQGTVIVTITTAALQAAMGASVDISANSNDPWVVVDEQPELGNELVFQADSVVTFTNVDPGAVTISVTPPASNICLSFPGLSSPNDYTAYEVHAGGVTAAHFICQ